MTDAPLLCPQCLAQVNPDWPFCTHCGTRLNASPPSAPRTPLCPNCGAAVDTSGAFCWKCGVPLQTGREPFIPAHPESPAGPEAEVAETARRPSLAKSRGSPVRRRGRTPSGGRAIAGSALRVLGIALVIAALFVAWYNVSSTGEEVVGGTPLATTGSLTFYPLNQFSIKLTCQGSPSCFSNTSGTAAYPQGTFDSIGTLYDIVAGLVIGGIVLSAVAMLLAFTGGRRGSRWAGTLALVAILVLVAAPVLLAVAQPSVLSSSGGSPTGGSSPDTSFFGSCSGNGCGSSMTPGETVNASWGPSAGWYLCWVGVAFLLAGLIVGRGQRNGARPPSVYDLVP